jgi:hypothetical protein
MITAKQAKKETLIMWRYLAEHPCITDKEDLLDSFDWLKNYRNMCPLCEYRACYGRTCKACVLYTCSDSDGCYCRWLFARTNEKRQQAALAIVERVEEWEVEK